MIALLFLLLATPGPICDATWHDDARNRNVPVRVRMPSGTGKVPLVVYSHGRGGDITGGRLWGEAWVSRGIAGSVQSLKHAAARMQAGQSVDMVPTGISECD